MSEPTLEGLEAIADEIKQTIIDDIKAILATMKVDTTGINITAKTVIVFSADLNLDWENIPLFVKFSSDLERHQIQVLACDPALVTHTPDSQIVH